MVLYDLLFYLVFYVCTKIIYTALTDSLITNFLNLRLPTKLKLGSIRKINCFPTFNGCSISPSNSRSHPGHVLIFTCPVKIGSDSQSVMQDTTCQSCNNT